MATMTPTGSVLLVTLTAEESALWKRGDTQEAAKYRLTIKHPANAAVRAAGLAKAVYVDHEGAFLEDSDTHVRRVDPKTIRQRCEARGVWPSSVSPARCYDDLRFAEEGWTETDAEDVKAWLHEAANAVADGPAEGIDLHPASETGAAVVRAANVRLYRHAIGESPDVG